MNARTAAELLFGSDRPAVDGTGVRVLLLDGATLRAPLLGGRFELLIDDPADQSVDPALYGRAYRRVSICAEGDEARSMQGGSLGVAPRASVVQADVPLVHDDAAALRRLAVESAADIVGICSPICSSPGVGPSPAARAQLTELAASGAHPRLFIAGTGGSLGSEVVEVGIAGDSTTGALLVDDSYVAARAVDASLGHLPAREAAVSMAVGLAALWHQWLSAHQLPTHPCVMRAALLATSHARHDGRYLDGRALLGGHPMVAHKVSDWDGEVAVRLVAGATRVTLAIVHCPSDPSPLWLADASQCAVTLTGARIVRSEPSAGALIVELEAEPGARVEARIQLLNGAIGYGVCVFVRGATAHEEPLRSRPPKRPLVILGLSASHDASACLMVDGRITQAIQLERITRKKRDGHPYLDSREAADYCLRAAGLRPRDVDLFAFNCQPLGPEYVGLSLPSHDADFDLFDPFGERALHVSHHLCHAFSAYFASTYDEATVFVCDGAGGTTTGKPDLILPGPALRDYLATAPLAPDGVHVVSAYRFNRRGFDLVDREYSPSFNNLCGSASLGETYAAVTQYVFGDWQESGKLMGLAPYGDPNRFGPSLLTRNEAGRLVFRSDWKNRFRRVTHRHDPLEYKDLAARIQRDLETALIERVRAAIVATGLTQVAYSGGVALNSVANQRLRMETGATSLYVLPASNDAGIAIGAAAAAHFHVTGETRGATVTDDFLGYAYRPVDYDSAISRQASLLDRHTVSLADVAERLASGQIIGWFDGAAEFGPRALGHRSILAAATDEAMWRYINARIKYREDFRPFAPMVPEEVAAEYFELDEPSPYMLRVVRVRPSYRDRLGAVTHVDGSARVQTIGREQQPALHELLHRYGAHSGIPVIVNTSLNVRGEPVVETPAQAIELLLATHLDALVFGHTVLIEPYRSRMAPDLTSVLALPPKTRLEAEVTTGTDKRFLVALARGRLAHELPLWAFDMLARLDGHNSVQTLFDELPSTVERSGALELLSALHSLRLVLAVRPSADSASNTTVNAASEVSMNSSATSFETATTAWRGAQALLTELDHVRLDGDQRASNTMKTIAAVQVKLNRLGVGRVADVTDYDILGIPVAACIRPFVDDTDITATQGKGMTPADALASALMETVERYSAWHRGAVPTEQASRTDLEAAGRSFIAPERLGVTVGREVVLEWVSGISLADGRERLVPAGEVFAPYRAPAGISSPLGWSSTGLASGNTLAEAVAHGLCEVVERDALSRYIDGEPSCLLDVGTIGEGTEESGLLQRFADAGLDVYVVDLSSVAKMACFSVCLYDAVGTQPRVAVAGQGASLSPRLALRRAMLEAAQGRVVAIQGSREDLIRHASQWVEDDGTRDEMWRASRALAARGGTSTLPAEPAAPATVAKLLMEELELLTANGYDDVVCVDLTHPAIGIPVVRVIVAGMYDGEADPQRRRRRPR